MPRMNYRPGDFDGRKTADSLEFDNDSGFTDTVENIETFTAPTMEPGEIWEITARMNFNTDPGNGPMFLEIREEGNGDIIARDITEEFSNQTAEVSVILPTWKAIGDFSGPASDSGGPEIRVNNTGGSSLNYFVDMVAVRIREGFVKSASRAQNGTVGGFTSGLLD